MGHLSTLRIQVIDNACQKGTAAKKHSTRKHDGFSSGRAHEQVIEGGAGHAMIDTAVDEKTYPRILGLRLSDAVIRGAPCLASLEVA